MVLKPVLSRALRAPTAMRGNPLEKALRAMFVGGAAGAWYDPSDLPTMFQESTGVTPAALEQPVGLILDKLGGYAYGSELASAGYATSPSFDNTTTGVTATGFSQVGGTTASRTYLNIPVVAGKAYEVTTKLVSISSSNMQVYIRDGQNGSGASIASLPSMVAGESRTGYFVAVDDTMSILWVTGAAGASATVSNISIREITGRTGLVRGPELVTNGDFSGGTTGWGTTNSVGLAVTGGALVGTNTTATYGRVLSPAFSIVAGRAYEVRIDCAASSQRAIGNVMFHDGVATAGSALGVGAAIGQAARQVITATATGVTRLRVESLSSVIGESFTIDNVSIRELAGNHASQATAAARPTLSARKNLLLNTASTLTAGATSWLGQNMSGVLQADGSSLLTRTSTAASCYAQQSGLVGAIGATITGQIKVKKGPVGNMYGLRLQGTYPDRADAVINLDTGAVAYSGGTSYTGITAAASGPDADGFYTLTLTATSAVSAPTQIIHGPANIATSSWETTSATLLNAYAKEPQLEYGPTATRYQRVNTATDYDAVGFPHYLKFDGVDDRLTFPGLSPLLDNTSQYHYSVAASRAVYGNFPNFMNKVQVAGTYMNLMASNANSLMGIERSVASTVTSAYQSPSDFGLNAAVLSWGYDGLRSRARTNLRAYTNGASDTRSMGTGEATPPIMGNNFTGNYYGGVFVARTPTQVEADNLTRYLANKIGVTL